MRNMTNLREKSNRSRRIVHLITSLGGGGTENFLFQILSKTPADFDHEVFYLGKDGVNGDRVRRLGFSVKHVDHLYGFYRHLKSNPPDILHTCLYWGHQIGRVVGRTAGVPFIISSHQSIDVWQKPWHGWIDRWTLPLCNVVDINSDAAQQVLEHRLRHATRKPRFVKVENGVDFSHFQQLDRVQSRQALEIPADALVGGTLMRLHAEKGAEKIPAFARRLLNTNPKLILLVGGTGPMEAHLKHETRDLGTRLRWMGWQEDTARFLSALDFFWLLSREESFPQALLEASAMGLPWIAPDVGGIHELVNSGACGLLSSAGSAESMATAGEMLLSDLSARSRTAREAIGKLSARYSLDVMARAFYSALS
jgi:glycosyltransferase involved in cell wall biosynthesis